MGCLILCCDSINPITGSFLPNVDALLGLGVVVHQGLVQRLVWLAVIVGQDLKVQLWDPYLLVVVIVDVQTQRHTVAIVVAIIKWGVHVVAVCAAIESEGVHGIAGFECADLVNELVLDGEWTQLLAWVKYGLLGWQFLEGERAAGRVLCGGFGCLEGGGLLCKLLWGALLECMEVVEIWFWC